MNEVCENCINRRVRKPHCAVIQRLGYIICYSTKEKPCAWFKPKK